MVVVEEPGGSYRAISTRTVTVLDLWLLLLLAGKKHSSSQPRTRSDPDFSDLGFFLEQDISSGGLDPGFEEASKRTWSLVKESTNVSLLHPLVLSESFCGKVIGWSAMDALAPQPVMGWIETWCRVGGTHVGGLSSETRWLACDVFASLLGPMLCQGSVARVGFPWPGVLVAWNLPVLLILECLNVDADDYMRLGAAFWKPFSIAQDFDLDFTFPEEVITLANRCHKLQFGESPVPRRLLEISWAETRGWLPIICA